MAQRSNSPKWSGGHVIKLLIDTNVILDALMQRQPWADAAGKDACRRLGDEQEQRKEACGRYLTILCGNCPKTQILFNDKLLYEVNFQQK
ncbi:hypothetical protein FACS1894198_7000 [Clostridia bacterium]|nr:hypothetical protein FACS1894198_7000 [Clostridia bacterium]